MSHRHLLLLLMFAVSAFTSTGHAFGQSGPPLPPSDELHREIAAMDSVMFSTFNRGDLNQLKTLFTRDLEFYHDKSGLTSYDENMAAFEELFSRGNGLTRELVPGSLEVYPIPGYGAIEVGKHTFCHDTAKGEDCGTFPFVQVWRKVGDTWKVSRVISYGH
ncbi:DUF4440 domain-containing protein [Longibacter salinarum]|uniref:DUF4440 domain-containing protein n=1 Tax=Longibacter salinarum TaxID=1850348 RepID=A0A2A8CVD0_9BACT|nr:nuclear transport factor 2 family protein [Longibacter salinarum]PEN12665.1 DUF4440 domain-containing protein [Longibacter salinarum]